MAGVYPNVRVVALPISLTSGESTTLELGRKVEAWYAEVDSGSEGTLHFVSSDTLADVEEATQTMRVAASGRTPLFPSNDRRLQIKAVGGAVAGRVVVCRP